MHHYLWPTEQESERKKEKNPFRSTVIYTSFACAVRVALIEKESLVRPV